MQPAFVWISTKNEWNLHNTIWSGMFGPSITRNLIMHVLTICHMKLKNTKHSMGAKVFWPSIVVARTL